MDTRLALMCGSDIPVAQCAVTVHQPTIKDISMIGEKDFFVGLQCLCLDKSMYANSQGKNLLEDTSNFQIFMTIISQEGERPKRYAVQQTLLLLFPGYHIILTPLSIILKKEGEDSIIIDNNNFQYLQPILKEIFCQTAGPMDQQAFNPANDKAREIAEKLMRGRERVAAQKGDQNASILSQYISMLTVGLQSMSLQDLMKLTMFQLYDLVERYQLYIAWDLDIKTRLAGGKPDSQPDNWMKNIH